MQYTNDYSSPLGKILMACDDEGLTGLWFYGQKYFAKNLDANHVDNSEHLLLNETKRWLNIYFSGSVPDFTPALHVIGTEFQIKISKTLSEIPYGTTTTYNEIAKKLSTSPRAVGAAVGRNNISIIIPCHRVLGSNGDLVGYSGGIERKKELLKIEGQSKYCKL